MENTLKDLLKLAGDFRAMSLEVNDWSCQTYKDEGYYMRCYFADSGDHSSITFEDSGVSSLEIAFFDPPTFTFGKQLATNKALKDLLIRYRIFYNKLRRKLKAKTRKERELERLRKIDTLEEELKVLRNKL